MGWTAEVGEEALDIGDREKRLNEAKDVEYTCMQLRSIMPAVCIGIQLRVHVI